MKGLLGTNSNFLIIITLQPDFVECRPLIFINYKFCEIKNIKCKDIMPKILKFEKFTFRVNLKFVSSNNQTVDITLIGFT